MYFILWYTLLYNERPFTLRLIYNLYTARIQQPSEPFLSALGLPIWLVPWKRSLRRTITAALLIYLILARRLPCTGHLMKFRCIHYYLEQFHHSICGTIYCLNITQFHILNTCSTRLVMADSHYTNLSSIYAFQW